MKFASNHPQGLYTLFFTEMWERFSYYGMRALLVLYLVNALEYERADALQIYATYTALVYITPIIGGYLADKYLGQRNAILIGAILMSLGHFAMAVPSLLNYALGLLVAGNGFFKPNISTLVGSLYNKGDERRDSGFTIFYMGINLGAFFSPLVCGTLGEIFGWHYGFAAAGLGMLFGLLIFIYGQSRIIPSEAPKSSIRQFNSRDYSTVLITCLATTVLVVILVALNTEGSRILTQFTIGQKLIFGLLLIATSFFISRFNKRGKRITTDQTPGAAVAPPSHPLTTLERKRILAILIMGLFVIFFWMGFEQAGGTMNLFADKHTDRFILGWEMPASYFQSVNPLLILLLAPFFSVLWVKLEKTKFRLSVVAKQAIGMIILGMGFMVLAVAQEQVQSTGKVHPIWLLSVYFLHTVGELCLSPIGLSMVSKFAPSQFVSMMMGVWFTAVAIANYLAGTLESILTNYHVPLYWFLVLSSIGAGSLLLVLSPLINKLLYPVHRNKS